MSGMKGFTGVSFPFRFDGRGGVAVSTTSVTDFSHIRESIIQIVLTQLGERRMELDFGSEVRDHVFSMTDDETDIAILKYEIKEAVERFDDRVEVTGITVTHDETMDGEIGWIVDVDIYVKKYLKNDTVRFKLNP